MLRFPVGALALGAAALLAVGLPTQVLAESSGTEHFTLVIDTASGGPVQMYGVFNAQGVDVEHTPTNTRTGTSTFKFDNGTVTLSHTDDRGGTGRFDKEQCVAHFSGTGDYHYTRGTGAYRDISGSGTYSFNGSLIFPHTSTGCGHNPIGQLIIVHASGPVSLG